MSELPYTRVADRDGPIKVKLYTLMGRLGDDACAVQITAFPSAYHFPEVRETIEKQARQQLLGQYPGVTVGDGEWADHEIPRGEDE